MDLGIRGKGALVCGASQGLGYACARSLAGEGVRVAICARTAEAIEEAARRIEAETGSEAVPIPADVAREADREALVARALERLGAVDILVTNCGGPPPGSGLEVSDESIRAALDANLLAAVSLVRRLAPAMRDRGWGRIVNITSIAAKQPIDGLILSNMTRAALVGFSKTVSRELGRFNVLVHNVAPGIIQTARVDDVMRDRAVRERTTVGEQERRMIADIPVGRLGRPEELGDLVAFLCSERASYMTGNTIQVDGGLFRGLM